MAIRDLLWACPLCGAVGGLAPGRGGERCTACGASFRRADRSRIQARLANGRVETRPAAEWAARLPSEPPAPAEDGNDTAAAGDEFAGGEGRGGEVRGEAGDRAGGQRWGGEVRGEAGDRAGGQRRGGEVRGEAGRVWISGHRERVIARFALGDEPIRRGGVFLGSMERLGPKRPGTLALTADALELRLDDGEQRRWPLDEIAALQASSSTLQLRPRGEPIVSLGFPRASARLWGESIAAALRRRWRQLGRGDIVEFQPRIVARPVAAAMTGSPGSRR